MRGALLAPVRLPRSVAPLRSLRVSLRSLGPVARAPPVVRPLRAVASRASFRPSSVRRAHVVSRGSRSPLALLGFASRLPCPACARRLGCFAPRVAPFVSHFALRPALRPSPSSVRPSALRRSVLASVRRPSHFAPLPCRPFVRPRTSLRSTPSLGRCPGARNSAAHPPARLRVLNLLKSACLASPFAFRLSPFAPPRNFAYLCHRVKPLTLTIMSKIRPNYYHRHPRGTQQPSASRVGEASAEPQEPKASRKAK